MKAFFAALLLLVAVAAAQDGADTDTDIIAIIDNGDDETIIVLQDDDDSCTFRNNGIFNWVDNWVSAEYGVGFNDGPGSFVVSSGTMNIQNYDVDAGIIYGKTTWQQRDDPTKQGEYQFVGSVDDSGRRCYAEAWKGARDNTGNPIKLRIRPFAANCIVVYEAGAAPVAGGVAEVARKVFTRSNSGTDCSSFFTENSIRLVGTWKGSYQMATTNLQDYITEGEFALKVEQQLDNGLIWGHTETSDPVFKFASGSQFIDFVGTVALDDGSDFAFLEDESTGNSPVQANSFVELKSPNCLAFHYLSPGGNNAFGAQAIVAVLRRADPIDNDQDDDDSCELDNDINFRRLADGWAGPTEVGTDTPQLVGQEFDGFVPILQFFGQKGGLIWGAYNYYFNGNSGNSITRLFVGTISDDRFVHAVDPSICTGLSCAGFFEIQARNLECLLMNAVQEETNRTLAFRVGLDRVEITEIPTAPVASTTTASDRRSPPSPPPSPPSQNPPGTNDDDDSVSAASQITLVAPVMIVILVSVLVNF